MEINEIISYLKHGSVERNIHLSPGAIDTLICKVEQCYGIVFPEDIKLFYKFTNGFETDEHLFNIISLDSMIQEKEEYGAKSPYIAEYLIYSDMWGLDVNSVDGSYTIFNDNQHDENVVLTNSLAEFLECFLKNGLLGLIKWGERMRNLE